jgi:hypothetical protein
VSDLPDDYYDTYVWQIVRILREGADEATLAQHLCDVEQINFGRNTPVEALRLAAASLVALGIEKVSS